MLNATDYAVDSDSSRQAKAGKQWVDKITNDLKEDKVIIYISESIKKTLNI